MKMDAQTVTIVSGVLLVGVFVLVGWILRRKERGQADNQGDQR